MNIKVVTKNHGSFSVNDVDKWVGGQDLKVFKGDQLVFQAAEGEWVCVKVVV